MMFGQWLKSHRILARQARALIRLRVCAGWFEPLLVAQSTLFEISCCGSYVYYLPHDINVPDKVTCNIRIHHECEGGIENKSRGSPFGITRLAEG